MAKPLKTLMLAPQPFFQPRGTPFSVLHRLTALSRLGYSIDLVTYPIGEDVEIENVRIIRAARVPFVKNVAIGPSKTKLLLDWVLYRRAVQMLRQGDYNLLHTHEEAGFMGIHLSRKFNLLHLYDMHSSLPQQLNNFKYSKSRPLLRVFEWLERKTIESADAVITICPELWQYVDGRYPGKFNKLIENVADNSIVFGERQSQNGVITDLRLNGEKLVLYAGTFEPYQGLDLLLHAAKTVIAERPEVKFVLVGGKPQQVEQYKSLAAELQIAEHCLFTGQRPPEEVPEFVKAVDILVSPRVEGTNTPLKIYSYLRSGIPIVATKHVTHTQVLNPDVAVLTEVKADDFADGILKVVQDQEYAQSLAARAKALAEREYSYEVYLKKTAEVYAYLEERLAHS